MEEQLKYAPISFYVECECGRVIRRPRQVYSQETNTSRDQRFLYKDLGIMIIIQVSKEKDKIASILMQRC